MRIRFIPNVLEKSVYQDFEVEYRWQTLGDYYDELFGPDADYVSPIISGREADWGDIPGRDDDVIFVKMPKAAFGVAMTAIGEYLASISISQLVVSFIVSFVAGAVLSLVTNALFGTKASTESTTQDSSTYSWDGIQNAIGEGNPVPVVYGRHRVGGTPIEVFVDGSNQNGLLSGSYLNALMAVSEGPVEAIDVNTIQLNKQDITQYSNVTTWTRMGDQIQVPLDFFSKIVTQYNITGVQITSDASYIYKTNDEVNGIQGVITFAMLGSQNTTTGAIESYSVGFGFQYRKYTPQLDQPWQDGGSLVCTNNTTSQTEYGFYIAFPTKDRYQIRITRTTGNSSSTTIFDKSYFTTVLEQENSMLGYPNTALMGFRIKATDRLSGSIPTVTVMVSGRKIKDVRTGAVAYSNNPANVLYDILTNERYGLGRYFDDSKLDLDSFQEFANWCDEVVSYRYYDSAIGDYVSGSQKRYELNFVIDQTYKALDIVGKICGTCRAIPFWVGEKLKIVIEKPGTPVQMFTMGNIVKDSFQETYLGLTDIPNQVEAYILDENDDYARKAITGIDKTRLSEAANVKSINLFGLTSLARAKREVVFALKKLKGTKKYVTFETGIGGVVCEPGDLFYFSHDVPQYGYGGHITKVIDDRLYLSRSISMELGKQYNFRVKRADNTFYGKTFTASEAEYDVVVFEADSGHGVSEGDIFAFGSVEKGEAKVFRAISITRKRQNTVEIKGEEYNESVFNEDESIDVADLKNSQLGLTKEYELDGTVANPTPTPLATGSSSSESCYEKPPNVTDISLSETLELVGQTWQSDIQVNFATVRMSANSLAHITKYGVLYSTNEGASWRTDGYTTSGAYTIHGVQVGKTYYIAVKAFSNYGVTSDGEIGAHSLDFSIIPLGKTTPPLPPTHLSATAGLLCNKLKWTNPGDKDIDRIEIWCSVGGGKGPEDDDYEWLESEQYDFETDEDFLWKDSPASGEVSDRNYAVLVGATKGNTWTHADLVTGNEYSYWVRAVDTSGNVSSWEPAGAGATASPLSDPAKILDILSSSITESQLAKDLNTRLDSIEILDGRASAAEVAIDEANASINLTVGRVDTVVSQLELVKNQFTVKIDANGNIAGIGLVSYPEWSETATYANDDMVYSTDQGRVYRSKGDSNTGNAVTDGDWWEIATTEARSQFLILANRFAIVNPADPGQPAKTPFVVGTVNGESTIGIDGALVVDGSITSQKLYTGELITQTAQIGDAIITNAKITSGLDAGKITTGVLNAGAIAIMNLTADSVAETGYLKWAAESGATVGATAGSNLKDSSGSVLSDGDVVTSQGTAASIQNQGALATKDYLDDTSQFQTHISGPLLPNITPGSAGLYLTQTGFGYWDGSNWSSAIMSNGQFYFRGSGNNWIIWNGSVLDIRGAIYADDITAGTLDVNRLANGAINAIKIAVGSVFRTSVATLTSNVPIWDNGGSWVDMTTMDLDADGGNIMFFIRCKSEFMVTNRWPGARLIRRDTGEVLYNWPLYQTDGHLYSTYDGMVCVGAYWVGGRNHTYSIQVMPSENFNIPGMSTQCGTTVYGDGYGTFTQIVAVMGMR